MLVLHLQLSQRNIGIILWLCLFAFNYGPAFTLLFFLLRYIMLHCVHLLVANFQTTSCCSVFCGKLRGAVRCSQRREFALLQTKTDLTEAETLLTAEGNRRRVVILLGIITELLQDTAI